LQLSAFPLVTAVDRHLRHSNRCNGCTSLVSLAALRSRSPAVRLYSPPTRPASAQLARHSVAASPHRTLPSNPNPLVVHTESADIRIRSDCKRTSLDASISRLPDKPCDIGTAAQ